MLDADDDIELAGRVCEVRVCQGLADLSFFLAYCPQRKHACHGRKVTQWLAQRLVRNAANRLTVAPWCSTPITRFEFNEAFGMTKIRSDEWIHTNDVCTWVVILPLHKLTPLPWEDHYITSTMEEVIFICRIG